MKITTKDSNWAELIEKFLDEELEAIEPCTSFITNPEDFVHEFGVERNIVTHYNEITHEGLEVDVFLPCNDPRWEDTQIEYIGELLNVIQEIVTERDFVICDDGTLALIATYAVAQKYNHKLEIFGNLQISVDLVYVWER